MLTILWALPAAAALLIALAGRRLSWLAPILAGVAFFWSLALWSRAGGLVEGAAWYPGVYGHAVAYRLGLSGLSLLLVALTLLVTTLSCVAALKRGPAFLAWLSMLGASATGMFLARDLVLFYVFWELMLVPTYFLLVGWGGAGSARAAWKFLLYNIAGSVALLLAVAALVAFGVQMPGVGVTVAAGGAVPAWAAGPLTLLLVLAIAVKTPLFPLHGWVADTYTELPAPAAALVSGVQSKAGLYAMLAILLPLLPGAARAWAPVLVAVGIVSLLYGAFVALAADEARHLLAYSSVSHLGLVFLAFATLRPVALAGGVVQLVAHGLFSAGLFLLVGMLEERLDGPVRLRDLGGLARAAPALAGGLILLAMTALGLPGLASFPAELLMVIGIYQYSGWLAVLAAVGLVLAAVYMLRMVQLVLHGAPTRAAEDLRGREKWLLAPLAALVLLIGLWPRPVPRQAAAAVAAVTAPAAAGQGGSSQ